MLCSNNMSKSPNSKHNNNQTSSCFNNIFQTLICGGNNNNLSTNASLPDQKPAKIHPFTRQLLTHSNDPGIKSQVQVQVQAQAYDNPGIIARLMGLESLPKYETVSHNDVLSRSKSMNSVQFLPDFDPVRAAFHRRARTSASYHEQGHNKFLVKIDENVKFDDDEVVGVKKSKVGFPSMKQRKKESKENNEVVLGDESKKSRHNRTTKDRGSKKTYYDECSTSSSSSSSSCGGKRSKLKNRVVESGVVDSSDCVREKCAKQKRKLVVRNNKSKGKFDEGIITAGSTVSSSKKKDDHKQEMCSEIVQSDDFLPSRSPVSVLEHHQEIFSKSKVEGRQITSNATRKSSPKSKLYDHLRQEIVPKISKQQNQDYSNKIVSQEKLVKEEEVEAADGSVEMLGHILKLAEDNIKDSKWVANYDVFKVQFVEDLCVDLGHELLDLLLDELVLVVIMSFYMRPK